jgi:hypothetical protein
MSDAADENATKRPSAEIAASQLVAFGSPPPEVALTRANGAPIPAATPPTADRWPATSAAAATTSGIESSARTRIGDRFPAAD